MNGHIIEQRKTIEISKHEEKKEQPYFCTMRSGQWESGESPELEGSVCSQCQGHCAFGNISLWLFLLSHHAAEMD